MSSTARHNLGRPEGALEPSSAAEVVELVRAHSRVTVVGNRTSFPFATMHGAPLSTRRLDRVLDLDRANMVVVVEPGIGIGHLVSLLREQGFWLPPLERSHPDATLGGLLASSAASRGAPSGPGSGPIREYVLGLRFVIGSGELISSGGRAIKYATGYNLTQTVVGSWGTLGAIVEATLRVVATPRGQHTQTYHFPDAIAAARAALALGERPGILAADLYPPAPSSSSEPPSLLTVTIQGSLADVVTATCATFDGQLFSEEAPGTARPEVGGVLPAEVALPRGQVAPFLEALGGAGDALRAGTALSGSPATGYLALHLPSTPNFRERARDIFDLALRFGGAPIGPLAWSEIGVPAMRAHLGESGIAVLRTLKQAFDPRGVFPSLPVTRVD